MAAQMEIDSGLASSPAPPAAPHGEGKGRLQPYLLGDCISEIWEIGDQVTPTDLLLTPSSNREIR